MYKVDLPSSWAQMLGLPGSWPLDPSLPHCWHLDTGDLKATVPLQLLVLAISTACMRAHVQTSRAGQDCPGPAVGTHMHKGLILRDPQTLRSLQQLAGTLLVPNCPLHCGLTFRDACSSQAISPAPWLVTLDLC